VLGVRASDSIVPIVGTTLERGIDLRLIGQEWIASSGDNGGISLGSSLPHVLSTFLPLRPIVVTERRNDRSELRLLLCIDGHSPFDVSVSDLVTRPMTANLLYAVHHLSYLLGAISYHCARLADWYARIAATYSQQMKIPGIDSRSDSGIYSYQTEPYFEFEALIGASRRCYDAMRYVLWPKFGSDGRSMPRSLKSVLAAKHSIPDGLADRLSTSWERHGVRLTEYRDCIHHYVPVDFGLASAFMRRHSVGAWTTMIRIPDNPEARSKRDFTFFRDVDALSYGWELANELLNVVSDVVEAVVPRPTNA